MNRESQRGDALCCLKQSLANSKGLGIKWVIIGSWQTSRNQDVSNNTTSSPF
jgi:hypothetical protein